MEEIIKEIARYHQLGIWCFAGMILCAMLALWIYKKKNIRAVAAYYKRRKKRKQLWMIIFLSILCCTPGFMVNAAEAGGMEGDVVEELKGLIPVLEEFCVGTDDAPMEYVKGFVEISIRIRDEQLEFDPEKVILEYRIADTEIWNVISPKDEPWDNPQNHLFETVYEFSGEELSENSYEFRISYVDEAKNPMSLGEMVQAEAVEGCEGTYLAKKQVVIDQLPPSYEVHYQNEAEEELQSSEDGTELMLYYLETKEVILKFETNEPYLDMENSGIHICVTDLKGQVIDQKSYKLPDGKFQTSLKMDGHYLIKAYLVDLAGNETLHEKKFALDHTPPEDPFIRYKTESGSFLERILNKLTFGYFSNEKLLAFIRVEDKISGLKELTYSYKDISSETMVTKTLEEPEVPLKIDLPFSFKGNIWVQSRDFVGNVSEEYVSIGVISESEQTHQKESKAAVEVLSKHDKTPNFYAGDVKLKYSVKDSYSGVKEIKYLAGNYEEETVTYGEEAEIATDRIDKEYTLSASDNQENNIEIGLTFTDNAGHVTTVEGTKLPKIHIDTISPKINVIYDNYEAENEKYYKKERIAAVYVTEKNFDPEDVEFSISGPSVEISSWSHVASADCQGDDRPEHTGHSMNCVWKCYVKFQEDGEYRFGFSCADLAGNQGTYGKIDEFVIDKTVPAINVVYDNVDVKNEIYYDAPRIARITIKEKNFDPQNVIVAISAENEGAELHVPNLSNWTSAGEIHQAAITYDYDGKFTFDIEFTDLAGNEASDYPVDYFCVDLTKPKIVITEIADKSANNGVVSPLITVTDTNYGNENTWFELIGWENGLTEVPNEVAKIQNGEMIRIWDFEHVQEADDLYRLTVGAADLAGNVSETRISFSVNRFGSVYTLDEETEKLAGKNGSYYSNVEKELVITETNVDTLELIEIVCSLNGRLRTLVEGKDYIVNKSEEELGWKQYQYRINKENFIEDGHYVITIYSEDRAKNISDNQSKGKNLSFAVDKTPPVIVISGVEQNGRYRENARTILLDVQDNLSGVNVQIRLNEETTVYDMEMLTASKGKIKLTAGGKNEWQTLTVWVEDQAGNQRITGEITFLVTPNILVQFYHNKQLFYGTLTTIGIAAVLGAGFLVYRRKKHGIFSS